jgi:hypothetical protein
LVKLFSSIYSDQKIKFFISASTSKIMELYFASSKKLM